VQLRPVIVVGSGPAGTSTALHLHALAPELASEILVLEKARHPRPKVCAGGLIPAALRSLHELGLELEVPHVVIDRARVDTPRRRVEEEEHGLCYVIRRNEFDASLASACRARGIEIREGEGVKDVRRVGDEISLRTATREYRARMVVAADGSGSIVRRRLFGRDKGCLGRAVMADVPVQQSDWDGFDRARYEFDFRELARGMRGYRWAFPCLIDGVPHVNLGAYTLTPTGAELDRALDSYVGAFTRESVRRCAFPIHWYRRAAPLAAPGVVLTGDAAGVDPLMGEGISLSLDYGRFAAEALQVAFRDRDYSGEFYRRSIEQAWLGKKLRRLHLGARLFYGPMWKAFFAVAERSSRARSVGLRWYNGVDEWDRRSGWEAVRAVLLGA
jgi:menaquinone-9 beta-reductase